MDKKTLLSLRLFAAWIVLIPAVFGFVFAYLDKDVQALLVGIFFMIIFIVVHPKRKDVRAL